MARLPFPDDRTVYAPANGIWRTAQTGTVVAIYVDSNPGVDPPVPGAAADVLRSDGTTGTIIVDSTSQMAPWQGTPDGATSLIVQIAGGPFWRVRARTDARVDSLNGRVTALEPGGGAAALQATANLGDLTSVSAARVALGLGSAATTSTAAYDPAGSASSAVAGLTGTLGSAATRDTGTSPSQVILGSDSRLSDVRTPIAHASAHQPGGSDPLAVDAAAATGSLRTLGTGAAQAASGSDSRITGAVQNSRLVTAGTGLTGGGDLSADRTLAVAYGTSSVTAAAGNDLRITGAVQSSTVAASTSTTLVGTQLSGDLLSRLIVQADGTIGTGESPLTVSNVTGTTTVTVTTAASHGYGTNDRVKIAGVNGFTGANGTFTITRVASTTFTLQSTTGSGTYTSGGTVQRSFGGTGGSNEGVWTLLIPDTARDGLVIRLREGSTKQGFIVRDPYDAPIFSVAPTGGAGVYSSDVIDTLFIGRSIFNRDFTANAHGGIRAAAGDPAGGIEVFALGNATTAPTGNPDGTHLGEGSFATTQGVIAWSRDGRLWLRTSAGHEDELLAPVRRRVSSVTAPGGDTTLITSGTALPTVATTNITATVDDQAAGPLVKYTTTAATNVDAGVISTFGIIQPRWAPHFYARVQTDAADVTSNRIAVGLVSADIASNLGPSTSGAYAIAQGAWIRYSSAADGTAFWRTVTADGANATVTTTTVPVTVDTSYEMTIEFDGTAATVRFWIGTALVTTHTTNLPAASAALGYTTRLRTLATSARSLRVGRVTWSLRG